VDALRRQARHLFSLELLIQLPGWTNHVRVFERADAVKDRPAVALLQPLLVSKPDRKIP
jgi:hypothetical protein